jgi:hypothetical protein
MTYGPMGVSANWDLAQDVEKIIVQVNNYPHRVTAANTGSTSAKPLYLRAHASLSPLLWKRGARCDEKIAAFSAPDPGRWVCSWASRSGQRHWYGLTGKKNNQFIRRC